MTPKKKICVPVLSRANYGRLKSVLLHIKKHPLLELQLIVGASALLERYGCLKQIEADGFKIDSKIYCVIEGDRPSCMASTTGFLTSQLSTLFPLLKPDIVLVHADRYEMLAVAIAASYSNIPLAHTQGGEVSGSIDDKVRDAISMMADLHFPATDQSKKRLISMGIEEEKVFNVGCPSIDLIKNVKLGVNNDINNKYSSVGAKIDFGKEYMVVMYHPVTTDYGKESDRVKEIIKSIEDSGKQTIWLWPNIDVGTDHISKELRRWRESGNAKRVAFYKNFSPEDYYRIIANCSLLIGNTSSGIREGAFLGVPYLCIGNRQIDRECASNTLRSVYDSAIISHTIKHMLTIKPNLRQDLTFGYGTAGRQIADILAGDFI